MSRYEYGLLDSAISLSMVSKKKLSFTVSEYVARLLIRRLIWHRSYWLKHSPATSNGISITMMARKTKSIRTRRTVFRKTRIAP